MFHRVRGVCSITGAQAAGTRSLVPIKEELWFNTNQMDIDRPKVKYPMRIQSNTIYLRPDMQTPFDLGSFAIVPKLNSRGMRYVMTVLWKWPTRSWSTFDGEIVQHIALESKRYLFARFAWAIFVHANPWIGIGDERAVLRLFRDPDTDSLTYERENTTLSQLADEWELNLPTDPDTESSEGTGDYLEDIQEETEEE